ncbi:MAG: hypothetical protein RMJ36_00760 [Candidatus Calescibacterium sp.]|nr:hypothetical protein [Candidatus Calescibacterium sp.]MDW8132174.1 hypothetical protein [Candidatus Calescibacterium sp.]
MSNSKNKFEGKHSIVIISTSYAEKKIKKEFYSNFLKEEMALRKLQNYHFIPKLLGSDHNFLTIKMEKIEGVNLLTIIKLYRKRKISEDLILSIFKIIFKICFVMDLEKIYKDEWNRPFKHVIFAKESIKIIDFDRSVFNTSKKNTLQFLSFVFGFWKMFNTRQFFTYLYEFSIFYEKQIEKYQSFFIDSPY